MGRQQSKSKSVRFKYQQARLRPGWIRRLRKDLNKMKAEQRKREASA